MNFLIKDLILSWSNFPLNFILYFLTLNCYFLIFLQRNYLFLRVYLKKNNTFEAWFTNFVFYNLKYARLKIIKITVKSNKNSSNILIWIYDWRKKQKEIFFCFSLSLLNYKIFSLQKFINKKLWKLMHDLETCQKFKCANLCNQLQPFYYIYIYI